MTELLYNFKKVFDNIYIMDIEEYGPIYNDEFHNTTEPSPCVLQKDIVSNQAQPIGGEMLLGRNIKHKGTVLLCCFVKKTQGDGSVVFPLCLEPSPCVALVLLEPSPCVALILTML